MVSVSHFLKESRMYATLTEGEGCAVVGVTVTGRMRDVYPMGQGSVTGLEGSRALV